MSQLDYVTIGSDNGFEWKFASHTRISASSLSLVVCVQLLKLACMVTKGPVSASESSRRISFLNDLYSASSLQDMLNSIATQGRYLDGLEPCIDLLCLLLRKKGIAELTLLSRDVQSYVNQNKGTISDETIWDAVQDLVNDFAMGTTVELDRTVALRNLVSHRESHAEDSDGDQDAERQFKDDFGAAVKSIEDDTTKESPIYYQNNRDHSRG